MNSNEPINEFPIMRTDEGIVLFHPHIASNAKKYIDEVLDSRWIGQGPFTERFERQFERRFGGECTALSVGSGTDALHLSYILAGIQEGDEVIAPLFTCTATNIPLLYLKADIKFADVEMDTLNMDIEHVKRLITPRTKAIVCVHYGGLPCDMEALNNLASEYGIKIIEDAAHALGAKYQGQNIGEISDFTMFSFQAVKHITTADGGMLLIKDKNLIEKAKRIRWFGIDRSAKQQGIWENDITELGYKYQMNDIAAAMGVAALEEFDKILDLRQRLLKRYFTGLQDLDGLKIIGTEHADKQHAAWMMTVLAERRVDLQHHLRINKVESGQVHYRNDRYSIFGGRSVGHFPNMDKLEDKYLVLPLHTKMTEGDVDYICDVIRKGW